jgi:hypothetical protein
MTFEAVKAYVLRNESYAFAKRRMMNEERRDGFYTF